MAGLLRNAANAQQKRLSALESRFKADMRQRLRREAPRDTGKLRRSIKVLDDGRVRQEDYGWIQDGRGRHRGWVENAVEDSIKGVYGR